MLLALVTSAQEATDGGKAPASDASAGEAESGAEPEISAAETEPSAPEAAVEPDEEVAEPDPKKRVPLPAPTIEEIEVVGRRMKIEVPDPTVSAVGFDAAEIRAEGINDIRDLSNFTPSLEIKSSFAASNPTIFIRGVGLDDFNANAAGAVSIYQDGVYMQSPAGQLFQFFDNEAVTVLRGPQPVLFRNAEAGAILVNSRPPTDEFDAYLSGSYGNYDLYEAEAAVGGPIVPDWLSGRVSGSWGIRDGTMENRCADPANIGPRNQDFTCTLSARARDGSLKFQDGMDEFTNNVDAWAARGQLLLRVPLGENEMQWLANGHGGKNNSRATQYSHRGVQYGQVTDEPIFGLGDESEYIDRDDDPFVGDFNLDGPEDLSLWGTNLKGSLLFGDGYELRSLSAYEWHERFTVENTDANPKYALESVYEDTAWQFSQDLDLKGQWGTWFPSESGEGDWIVGAYYLQETLDVANNFDTAVGVPQHLTQEYTQKTRNYAIFAQSEYRFRPGCELIPCDFTLLTGARYNWEHKSFETNVCETGIVACDTVALSGSQDALFQGPGGTVSLAWDYREDSNLYLKYSRGWKGGHFNGGATTVRDIITGISPETINAYEGGIRSYWFDRRLMLNATGFYYDYTDLQVFIIEQTDLGYPIPKLINAADAVVYGAELDLSADPLPGLRLTYNFAWVKSEYLDFEVTLTDIEKPPRACRTCPQPPAQEVFKRYVYTGNPLLASPDFSMTGSVEYDVPIPGTLFGMGLGMLTPRFSFNWKDQIFFDTCSGKGTRCNFPEGYFGEEPVWVFNAALTWTSEDERFELTGWVHNFMNNYYKNQNFDLSEGLGVILDVYADPRMYGLTATISF
jgi:iron complex outermembrane receptor protein